MNDYAANKRPEKKGKRESVNPIIFLVDLT